MRRHGPGSGPGFAVVAEEIRKLADNSRETVTEIQGVTGAVIEAVSNLVEAAESMLGFMDSQVKEDYDAMQETGERYSEDARYIEELVTDFSATSEELLASIQSMLTAISETGSATNEGRKEREPLLPERSRSSGGPAASWPRWRRLSTARRSC